MQWLAQMFGVGARLVFYVVILAWVVIGQIKVPHATHLDARDKSPKVSGADRRGETTPVSG